MNHYLSCPSDHNVATLLADRRWPLLSHTPVGHKHPKYYSNSYDKVKIDHLKVWYSNTNVYMHTEFPPTTEFFETIKHFPNVAAINFQNFTENVPRSAVQWWRVRIGQNLLSKHEAMCNFRHLYV